MYQFAEFVSELDNILIDTLQNYPANRDMVLQLLDGRPASELRRLVPIIERRESGAFFTGSRLGVITVSDRFTSTLTNTSILVDPACGAGDLLLSCAPFLPISPDLSETLSKWRSSLLGMDIHSEFVQVTKCRLVLKAIVLGAVVGNSLSDYRPDILDGIRVGSFLQNLDILEKATHIVINPPFFMMPAPEACEWSNGKVNAAAVFLEACIKHAQKGTRIAAILPDVLRSGSRYEKWRQAIASRCEIESIHLFGQFDPWADVDIVVAELVTNNGSRTLSSSYFSPTKYYNTTIADKFHVSIGSVVDYRDPKIGPIVKFIRPHDVPAWETINYINNIRAFNGRTCQGPFVVVRRTSRQGDKHRAIGTIINTPEDVAVENHLIVLKPKDGTLSSCQNLITVLHDERTTAWLNETIRCRHLVLKSLADVPWCIS